MASQHPSVLPGTGMASNHGGVMRRYRVRTWDTGARCEQAAHCFFTECRSEPCPRTRCAPHLVPCETNLLTVTVRADSAAAAVNEALTITGRKAGRVARILWWRR